MRTNSVAVVLWLHTRVDDYEDGVRVAVREFHFGHAGECLHDVTGGGGNAGA